jgi:hypothetical protein
VVAAVCALLPTTGDAFVDGASYGDERRFLLRPPGAFLLGPIEFGWAIVVAGIAAGPLLLLARQWVVGAAVTIVGGLLAWRAWRSLDALSEPLARIRARRSRAARRARLGRTDAVRPGQHRLVRPAPAATDALDLSANALGLALQLDLAPATDARGDRARFGPSAHLRNRDPSSA